MRKAFLAVLLFMVAFLCYPISLSVTGSWNLTLNETDLSDGAGSDFISVHASATDELVLEVTGSTGDADNWEVQIHKEDTSWDGSLELSLLRTGVGTTGGLGTINGGDLDFVELTAVDQYFFDGSGDRADIDVQLRLKNVSVTVGAGLLETTVYFTLIDSP
jgi:hypothetical protein